LLGTVAQYPGVFANVIVQRPGPNLKSGSQTSANTQRIFMLSSVMKKLLFHTSAINNHRIVTVYCGKVRSVRLLEDRDRWGARSGSASQRQFA
jgi:hypothetical protein